MLVRELRSAAIDTAARIADFPQSPCLRCYVSS